MIVRIRRVKRQQWSKNCVVTSLNCGISSFGQRCSVHQQQELTYGAYNASAILSCILCLRYYYYATAETWPLRLQNWVLGYLSSSVILRVHISFMSNSISKLFDIAIRHRTSVLRINSLLYIGPYRPRFRQVSQSKTSKTCCSTCYVILSKFG